MGLTPSDVDRFWAKVYFDTVGHDCWEWSSARLRGGYGAFWLREVRAAKAHRISYELENGPIPDGLVVRHLCNNPGCVRPSHLAVGTAQDNVNDRVRAGRTTRSGPRRPARGASNGARLYPERLARGGKNHKVTTSDAVVAEAIRLYAAGGVTLAALGIQFGVSTGTVHRWIKGVTRKTWPSP